MERENKFLKGAINLWSQRDAEGRRMEKKCTSQGARRDRVLSIVLSHRAQLLLSSSMILRNRFKVKFKNLCRLPRYVSHSSQEIQQNVFLYFYIREYSISMRIKKKKEKKDSSSSKFSSSILLVHRKYGMIGFSSLLCSSNYVAHLFQNSRFLPLFRLSILQI